MPLFLSAVHWSHKHPANASKLVASTAKDNWAVFAKVSMAVSAGALSGGPLEEQHNEGKERENKALNPGLSGPPSGSGDCGLWFDTGSLHS